MWKRPKKKGHLPLRVVGDDETRRKVLKECHDFEASGHKGVRATYERVHQFYWWPRVYLDVREYVESCEVCQFYSKVKHCRDI